MTNDGFDPQDLLDRAISAELQLKSRTEELGVAQETLQALLSGDISETHAGMWMARAEHAEVLLGELAKWIAENPSVEELLPVGFASRVRAQLHTLEILHRDQKALGERLPDDAVIRDLAKCRELSRDLNREYVPTSVPMRQQRAEKGLIDADMSVRTRVFGLPGSPVI